MTAPVQEQEVPTNEDPPQLQEQATEDQEVEPEAKARSDKEARYRVRAKEAEAKALALQARIDAYQRQEIERVVAGTLSAPSDIWLLATDLTDLLNEDGEVDEEAALEAALELVAARPRMGRHQPVVDPTQGQGGGATSKVDWADFLRTT